MVEYMKLLEEVKFIGNNLVRPECVLVDKNETLHIADWRGGITLITKNGDQKTILAKGNFQPKPNGIACLLYTSPSPRDRQKSRMPSSA